MDFPLGPISGEFELPEGAFFIPAVPVEASSAEDSSVVPGSPSGKIERPKEAPEDAEDMLRSAY